MDLYIFPQAACLTDGYGIAVEHAYRLLSPKEDDVVVWYTNHRPDNIMYFRKKDYIIPKIPPLSWLSFSNIIRGRVRSELPVSKLSFLKQYTFEHIHCDEVIFYRALRQLFPGVPMTVRFHNCFSRILFRHKLLQNNIDLKFRITLRRELCIERIIFHDMSVKKVFLLDEDRSFYTSMFGRYSDSEVWPFSPNKEKALNNRTTMINSTNLVWFGGLDSHKIASMEWFVNNVYPAVTKKIPNVCLHLFGSGTKKFENPSKRIFGHGYYNGKDQVPMRNALYINPDIMGGGIKLKLMTYYEAGVPFITTFFGFEGYNHELVDGEFCMVEEADNWENVIVNYINNHKV